MLGVLVGVHSVCPGWFEEIIPNNAWTDRLGSVKVGVVLISYVELIAIAKTSDGGGFLSLHCDEKRFSNDRII